jgi:hypothetical protein
MTDSTVGLYGSWEGGADYDAVVDRLTKIFKSQGIVPAADSFAKQLPIPVRPVGLIFGRPACEVFQDELLPDHNYYHLRSDSNVELFYIRYADPDAEYLTVGAFDENHFSDRSFVSAVADFEERTTWQYSGQTDVILLNSFFSHKQNVYLDFTNVFAIQLEEAVASKLIPSGRSLIEEVMRQSRHSETQDVITEVSDVVFLRNARQSFLSWVMGLVKLKAEDLGNAYRSCVRDVSRRKGLGT